MTEMRVRGLTPTPDQGAAVVRLLWGRLVGVSFFILHPGS